QRVSARGCAYAVVASVSWELGHLARRNGASGTTTAEPSASAGRGTGRIPWQNPLPQVVKGSILPGFRRWELPAHWRDTTNHSMSLVQSLLSPPCIAQSSQSPLSPPPASGWNSTAGASWHASQR